MVKIATNINKTKNHFTPQTVSANKKMQYDKTSERTIDNLEKIAT